MATNIAAQRIKREFKEVIKSEEVSFDEYGQLNNAQLLSRSTNSELSRPLLTSNPYGCIFMFTFFAFIITQICINCALTLALFLIA